MPQRKTTFIFVVLLIMCVNLTYDIDTQNRIEKKYIPHKNVKYIKFENLLTKMENKKKQKDIKLKQQKIENAKACEETFVLTFYTSLIDENTKYGPITCNGNRLSEGMVANNILPQGTKISTKEFGELVVADKGGDNFNKSYRLDVYISRNYGENDYQYKKRVEAMGVVRVQGIIIK